MKHEPRPAIHMEKQPGWACNLGGTVSGDLQSRANSVSQVVGVSDIAPACSVALWREVSEWPVPSFLSGRKLSPSSRLDSSHFILSLCATGTSQAATWCWSLEGMNLNNYMCGFFRGTAWDSRSFSYRLNLCWFLQLEVMGTYLPGTGSLGLGGLVWGWDSLLLRYPC